jgi:hypothetical protein
MARAAVFRGRTAAAFSLRRTMPCEVAARMDAPAEFAVSAAGVDHSPLSADERGDSRELFDLGRAGVDGALQDVVPERARVGLPAVNAVPRGSAARMGAPTRSPRSTRLAASIVRRRAPTDAGASVLGASEGISAVALETSGDS